jgi:epoxyqueuosine reductase
VSERIEDRLKARARERGFELVGIARATEADGFARFRDWLARGYAGEMEYLHHHAEPRRHPESILPDVRSVVMVGMTYSGREASTSPPQPPLPASGRGGWGGEVQPDGREDAGLQLRQPGIALVHLLRVVDEEPAVVGVLGLADGGGQVFPQAGRGVGRDVTGRRRHHQWTKVGAVPRLVQSDPPGHPFARYTVGKLHPLVWEPRCSPTTSS